MEKLVLDWAQRIPRQPDGEAVYLHCTGGVRCAEHEHDVWHVEPFFDGQGASARGLLTKEGMRRLIHRSGLKPIAFQRVTWFRGAYHGSWRSINPGRTHHMEGAADLWGHIAANLSPSPDPEAESGVSYTRESLAETMDNTGEVARLARYIARSVRSVDVAVEGIAEYYNEHLINALSKEGVSPNVFYYAMDDALNAHVHSFFMNIGAARDYLAALIAFRMGRDSKIDSLARFIDKLKVRELTADPLLDMLGDKGYVRPQADAPEKTELSGWLQDITLLRNQFAHQRPYGSKSIEQMGHVELIDKSSGLYKYVRPVVLPSGAREDLLDVVSSHYTNMSGLFLDCAEISGYSTEKITFTEKDIISVEIVSGE